jgi:hypothetical protein
VDYGLPAQKQSRTDQTVDQYGNVGVTSVYDYGPGATPAAAPARVYRRMYLHEISPAHANVRIYDRLVSLSVDGGGGLISNMYDIHNGPHQPCFSLLTDRTGLRQHDPAINASYTLRGNVSQRATPEGAHCLEYDIGGVVTKTRDQLTGLTTTVTANADKTTPCPR